MRLVPRVEEALVVLVYSAHVLLVPGTKVEESFTLHATRDVVVRGTSPLAIPHVRTLGRLDVPRLIFFLIAVRPRRVCRSRAAVVDSADVARDPLDARTRASEPVRGDQGWTRRANHQ